MVNADFRNEVTQSLSLGTKTKRHTNRIDRVPENMTESWDKSNLYLGVRRTEGQSVSWTAGDMAAATWNLRRKTIRTTRCLADRICHSVSTTVEQNPSTALSLDFTYRWLDITYLHSGRAAWRKGNCWVLCGVFFEDNLYKLLLRICH